MTKIRFNLDKFNHESYPATSAFREEVLYLPPDGWTGNRRSVDKFDSNYMDNWSIGRYYYSESEVPFYVWWTDELN